MTGTCTGTSSGVDVNMDMRRSPDRGWGWGRAIIGERSRPAAGLAASIAGDGGAGEGEGRRTEEKRYPRLNQRGFTPAEMQLLDWYRRVRVHDKEGKEKEPCVVE